MSPLKVHRLAREARESGFTINLHGHRPTTGYAVALADCERRIPAGRFSDHLLRVYIADHLHDLSRGRRYLGAWRNGEEIVLDVVHVDADESVAVERGIENAQEAIFNLTTHTELRLR
jgi:hypothetical protein